MGITVQLPATTVVLPRQHKRADPIDLSKVENRNRQDGYALTRGTYKEFSPFVRARAETREQRVKRSDFENYARNPSFPKANREVAEMLLKSSLADAKNRGMYGDIFRAMVKRDLTEKSMRLAFFSERQIVPEMGILRYIPFRKIFLLAWKHWETSKFLSMLRSFASRDDVLQHASDKAALLALAKKYRSASAAQIKQAFDAFENRVYPFPAALASKARVNPVIAAIMYRHFERNQPSKPSLFVPRAQAKEARRNRNQKLLVTEEDDDEFADWHADETSKREVEAREGMRLFNEHSILELLGATTKRVQVDKFNLEAPKSWLCKNPEYPGQLSSTKKSIVSFWKQHLNKKEVRAMANPLLLSNYNVDPELLKLLKRADIEMNPGPKNGCVRIRTRSEIVNSLIISGVEPNPGPPKSHAPNTGREDNRRKRRRNRAPHETQTVAAAAAKEVAAAQEQAQVANDVLAEVLSEREQAAGLEPVRELDRLDTSRRSWLYRGTGPFGVLSVPLCWRDLSPQSMYFVRTLNEAAPKLRYLRVLDRLASVDKREFYLAVVHVTLGAFLVLGGQKTEKKRAFALSLGSALVFAGVRFYRQVKKAIDGALCDREAEEPSSLISDYEKYVCSRLFVDRRAVTEAIINLRAHDFSEDFGLEIGRFVDTGDDIALDTKPDPRPHTCRVIAAQEGSAMSRFEMTTYPEVQDYRDKLNRASGQSLTRSACIIQGLLSLIFDFEPHRSKMHEDMRRALRIEPLRSSFNVRTSAFLANTSGLSVWDSKNVSTMAALSNTRMLGDKSVMTTSTDYSARVSHPRLPFWLWCDQLHQYATLNADQSKPSPGL